MFNIHGVLKILTALIILSCTSYAQDPILEMLDNPDPQVRINALYLIQNQMLKEYSIELEQRMFVQDEPYIVDEYMRTLFIIQSANLEVIAQELINFADNYPSMEPPDDPLRSKVLATLVLFQQSNYSTISYAFEILDRDYPSVMPEAHRVLVIALKELPQYFEECKNRLINIVNYCQDDFTRLLSITVLKGELGVQILDLLVNRFQYDEHVPIKKISLSYLLELNYNNLNNLLKNRLAIEQYVSLRINIADTLLIEYGGPSDLKAVLDYFPNEPDEAARGILEHHTELFIPPKPDTLDYYGLANRLITYTYELLQYGWISTEIIRAFYETKLNDIIEAVQGGKYGKACDIINNTLLPTIEQHLNNSNITTEGYKFLHYYTIYIKEEIEEQYGACP